MKKLFFVCLLFFCTQATAYIFKSNDDTGIQTIVIFRHGEKPLLDMGQMVCKGLNRSLKLPRVLHAKFGRPDFLFAPKPIWNNYFYYVRAFVTLQPTAIQYDLTVNTNFYFNDLDSFANELLSPKYHNSLSFVAWEHFNAELLTKMIFKRVGAKSIKVPAWRSSDFDSIYIIKLDWRTNPITATFIHDYEQLNNEPTQCPVILQPTMGEEKFETVVIVADAEPAKADNQLSCTGLNRALLLPKALYSRYSKIDLFLLPGGTKQSPFNYLKPLMTIEPTIIGLGGLFIPVGQDFNHINQILDYPTVINEVAVITWPIQDMTNLAKSIYQHRGGNPNEIPIATDRNVIYEISFKQSDLKAKPRFKTFDIALPSVKECPFPLLEK